MVTPSRVTTDKAKCYPPALRAVLPLVEHRTSNYLNNGLELDHQHVKGRVQPLRWFNSPGDASNFCQGHLVIQNLGRGFSQLTEEVPPRIADVVHPIFNGPVAAP